MEQETDERGRDKCKGIFFSKINQHTNQILLPPPGSVALWD